MSQDEQVQQPQADAHGGTAATMPEQDWHPLAPAAQEMAQRSQGASAPDSQPSPEVFQQPEPAAQPEQSQQAESPEDYRQKYEELTRELEAREQQRQAEAQQFEQQQQAWMEFQRQQNEVKAAEARRAAEEQYRSGLKEAYERAVSADDDEAGLKALDAFVRERIANPIATTFQQRLAQAQEQHRQEMDQFRSEAEQALHMHFKPRFAEDLVRQHQLPDGAERYLLTAENPDQMPQMAEQLKTLLAQVSPQVQQQVMNQKVAEHRANGTFAVSGATGTPMRQPERTPVSSDDPQAVQAVRSLLGL